MNQYNVVVEDKYAGRIFMFIQARTEEEAEEAAVLAAYERGCTDIEEVDVTEMVDD